MTDVSKRSKLLLCMLKAPDRKRQKIHLINIRWSGKPVRQVAIGQMPTADVLHAG